MVWVIGWLLMFKSKFFLRYFLIATSLSFLFFILILVAAQLINKDFTADLPGQGQMRKMLDSLSIIPPQERVMYLEKNSFTPNGMRPFEIYLCDRNGNIVFPEGMQQPIDLSNETKTIFFSFLFAKDSIKQIEKLPGEPIQFLVFNISLSNAHSQIITKRHKFITFLGILSLALILGIFTGLFFMFSLLRNRAKHLDYVINEIHSGNLKARLEIGKMDDVGLMMSRFNLMADEIEILVNSLRKAETTRKELLRELAHDLRTPIASLKNILEMSLEKKHLLSEEQKEELLRISINEIEYFSSLVDDLLFLGQIQEPGYRIEIRPIILADIVQEEINQVKTRYPLIEINFTSNINQESLNADEKLMRRLFRNLLENSFSFAEKKIDLTVNYQQGHLVIKIVDDGAGFTDEALQGFGKKKAKRVIVESGSRISIGLGSVIMKSIVESCHGSIRPQNIYNNRKEIVGAQVDAILYFQ